MQKHFLNLEPGDLAIVYDEYSHDYVEHKIQIESVEYDGENATETNPSGMVCYGKDLGDWGDEYITCVTESNFIRIA